MSDPTQELLQALHEQTKAINALVQSNRELMDYLIGQEAEQDEGDEPTCYMDGTPVR